MMTPRDVVLAAIRYENPPYVPWLIEFTARPAARLREYFGSDDLDACVSNHVFTFRPPTCRMEEVAPGKYRDRYGTLWDRTIDKDIGTPCEYALRGPSLEGFEFPECSGGEEEVHQAIAAHSDLAVRFSFGFMMFERAWALRGMQDLLVDFIERPAFVHELLDAICEHDLKVLDWALQFDMDIVHFGDDWGQQRGLIMGPRIWREFIEPRLARLYARAAEAGKIVSIHSCGDVDELFDDLVEMGVRLFNPFQPEVMDIDGLSEQYHGKLAFHGGMSIQRILPFGSVEDVREETRRLIEKIGRGGGYIFAPSHAVPADVPVENVLASLQVLEKQRGYHGAAA